MTVHTGAHFFRHEEFPFHIDRYAIRPNEHISSHTHDFVELVFVVSGNAMHEMAGNRYTLREGDVFVIEPNIFHSYTATGEETIVYNALFDPDFLRRELDSLIQLPAFVQFFYLLPFLRRSDSFVPYQPLEEEQRSVILHHLSYIHSEYAAQREGWQLLVKTRWIECLVWLSRFLKDKPGAAPRPTVGDRNWIGSVCYFIEREFRQPLTLEQVSRLCGMSVSSFTAKFRAATGSSLVDYKHKIQIRHACRLLAETDRKITDIAYEAGFGDISFFNKIFRKHRGMTPKEYRRRAEGDSC
ncbi:helix-turn-helix domain-containing protein [Paenibacillaceae bacterium WGS1546]|uniref:AraC family transcriptional regulator n=1 Tax=Cohnella sp. WGS1546 TaxID=3366810 RepID=UPI00372D47F9